MPAGGLNDRMQTDLAPNHLAYRGFLHFPDDLGVDLALAFEHTEDDCLTSRNTSSFILDALGAEVRYVDFKIPLSGFGPNSAGDTLSDLESDRLERQQ